MKLCNILFAIVLFAQAPVNTRIKLTFEEFNVETSSDGTRCIDYMVISYFLPGQQGIRYYTLFQHTLLCIMNI